MKALRSEILSLNAQKLCDSRQLDSRLVIWIKSNGTLKIDLRRRSGDSEILCRRFDVVPQDRKIDLITALIFCGNLRIISADLRAEIF